MELTIYILLALLCPLALSLCVAAILFGRWLAGVLLRALFLACFSVLSVALVGGAATGRHLFEGGTRWGPPRIKHPPGLAIVQPMRAQP